ncbi:sulfite reductase flavoprotein subunit alpha [Saccharicrinis fermentans]|uniref:sulfite reductase flavoprotein subunit alpha n=1 Tax=Saccharicrinis fermentans TaxID=982 RepID=UPI0021D0AA42|nr:sulfite reductase flavoprotein subunit alpha [Saccharicrinis fermentans]
MLGKRNTSLGNIFSLILSLHKNLLINNIGKTIVGISILIFVFMLLSGWILWFPKRWKGLRRALTIKRKEGNSRFILDLHNVLGFYFIPVMLWISILGLYISFPWVKSALIVALGGNPVISQSTGDERAQVNSELSASFAESLAKIMAQKEDAKEETPQPIISLDSITRISNKLLPYQAITTIKLPDKDNSWISVTKINRENVLNALLPDLIELNKKGELKNMELFRDKSLSEQFIALSLPMHTGEILGWPSLILYFITCLVAMSLPVTGTWLWYKRLKNKWRLQMPAKSHTQTKKTHKNIQDNWLIAYASKSGNSKLVAQKAQQHFSDHGIRIKCKSISKVDLTTIPHLDKLFIVISTDGEGVPPPSANAFFHYLDHDTPNLDKLNYAICALGDSSYAYFCQAGKMLDTRLSALGGTAILSRVDCDTDFAKPATAWIKEVVAKTNHNEYNNTLSKDIKINAISEQVARIKQVQPITNGTSEKPCYHLVLQTHDSLTHIKPGDSIEIKPENPHWIVKALGEKIGIMTATPSYMYLQKNVELTSVSEKTARRYCEASENQDLAALLNNQHKAKRYLSKANFLDLLNDFPAHLDFQKLKEIAPSIKNRYYSIASCTETYPNEIHLTVKAIRYLFNNSIHEGAASIQITEKLKEGNTLTFKHYPNLEFRLPQQDSPLIMIGVGTGIAPFRAFLQNYQHRNIKNKCWLIWGDKNHACDYLYKDELQHFKKEGILQRMDLVFSRDGNKRQHVQDLLPIHTNEIINYLSQGAHLYVCGSMKMAADVKHTLTALLTGTSEDMDKLMQEERYHEDAY